MDGNRRYAEENSKDLLESYVKGIERLADFCKWAKEYEFTDVVAFAFSEDNWKRKDEDVTTIFKAVIKRINEEKNFFSDENIRVRFIGNIEKFPKKITDSIRSIEENTKDFDGINVWICASYSGRDDIVRAVNKKIELGEQITQEDMSSALSTSEFPDPECIIRTGGVKRLSSFLLWEAEYSQLYFIDILWPEICNEDFVKCMEEHKMRKVNNGT